MPDHWSQAASWLEEHDAGGRTLLLPGSRFAQYTWGTTGDEPIQALARTPWDIRNAVPLSSAGHIRWLDGIEQQVASGRGGPDLQRALVTGGVRYLLVRNDLAYGAAGATRLSTVRAALSTTPGVSLAASFGPYTGGGSSPVSFSDHGLNLALPAIEIYDVAGPGDPRVSVVPIDGVSRVVGGADAVSLEGMGGTDPFVLAGSEDGSTADGVAGGPLVLTDTPRRREANFGVGTFGTSHTLTGAEPLRIAKPTRDYGYAGDPSAEAVAVIQGVRSIGASSSASDADSYPRSDPGSMPYAAFDGTLGTQWRPNALKPVGGSWLSVDFEGATSLEGGRVTLDAGTPVTRLGVATDRGVTTVPVVDDAAILPAVTTTFLRVTFKDVGGDDVERSRAAVRDVAVPGITVNRTVRLPAVPGGAQPDRVVLSADVGRGACTFLGPRPLCAAGTQRVGEDAAGLDRTFTLPAAAHAEVTVSARAVPSLELQRRVEKALGLAVHATSSSVAVPDLAGGPMAAVDGDLGTAWVAGADDPDPAVTLAWQKARKVDELQVVLDGNVAATRPTHVRITSPEGTREVDLDESGRARFPALRTATMTMHLTAPALATSVDGYTFRPTFVGLGMSDVHIDGLTPDLTVPQRSSTQPVSFPCGEGPTLRVGLTQLETSVRTTVGELMAGAGTPAVVCRSGGDEPDPAGVQVPSGTVEVVAGAAGGWLTSSVVLSTGRPTKAGGGAYPTSDVTAWGATDRSIDVGNRDAPTLLVVRENANPGWHARLGNQVLDPVTVGGWQQGFVVPPGQSETVRLTFTPDGPFRVGLLVGAACALGLVLAAVVPGRRRPERPIVPAGRIGARLVTIVGAALLVFVGSWWGAVAVAVSCALVLVRRYIAPRASALWPLVAGAAYGAAGLLLLTSPYGSQNPTADRAPAQALSLLALAALAVSLWEQAPRRVPAAGPDAVSGDGVPTS